MKIELIFPITMIAISIGAAIVYYIKGDLNLAAYWLLAAGLNIVVTFQPFKQ